MSRHAEYLKMLLRGIRLDNNFSDAYMRRKKYCIGISMMNEVSGYNYCIKTCERFCSCHRDMYKIVSWQVYEVVV